MSRAYTPARIMSGTFGYAWLDGTPLPQITKGEAKVSLDKEEVKQTGKREKGYKIVGTDGKGSVTLNKIDSTMIELLSDDMKAGRTTEHILILSSPWLTGKPASLGKSPLPLHSPHGRSWRM